MTEHPTSSIKGTAARSKGPAPRPSSPPTPGIESESPSGPGSALLHTVLGPHGYRRLIQHRRHQHTALGALADLICTTAQEADRLHAQLRRHAAHAHDRYRDALAARGGYIENAEITAIQQHPGHAATLYAARLGQQLRQLESVLDAYRTIEPSTGI
ncbi:hypothetical protein OG746_37430 [Streptomyces sp. NBC_01016]|uniref:hypothetical protein n=1 Tax=Streptomyces sp. NBC_01016 TaxID=2903720 RepID=UPI00224C894E|nr:hypothetical protein [Streptomyces sp. NBC_01016]MCX4834406.1 hypothetical protein [Streptomyces sp. NBC_01016]